MNRLTELSEQIHRILSDRVGSAAFPSRYPGSFQSICRSVKELSVLFTRERADLKRGYFDEERLRSGYLAYFMPVNLAKIQALLDELPVSDQPDSADRTFNVLDLGSGPGTGALAVLDWIRRHSLSQHQPTRAVAIDRSMPVLLEAERLWNAYCRSFDEKASHFSRLYLDLERVDALDELTRVCPTRFDLIIIANAMNEIYRVSRDPIGHRVRLTLALLELLHPSGTLIILEPALRSTSRDLHALRDRLLEQKKCTVYSPCLHESPCPALIREEDWCHEERPWTPPPLVSMIDQEVGLIKDALKFSYVMLRKDGKTIARRGATVFRVVSELREMKGDKRAWLCNETGRLEVGRLDRERSALNAAMDQWHRGAIIQVDEIQWRNKGKGERDFGRIKSSSRVEIIRPIET